MYIHSICSDDFIETLLFKQKRTTFPPHLSLPHTHIYCTYTHTHTAILRPSAPSTRKETEIGNKDHCLCLRTVNRSSNVFNLSPESNNGAHSTPSRYCSTVRLKALGFSQFLSAFSLLCSGHEGIHSWDKKTGMLLRKEKRNYVEDRKVISG